jgi:hypothetical protein
LLYERIFCGKPQKSGLCGAEELPQCGNSFRSFVSTAKLWTGYKLCIQAWSLRNKLQKQIRFEDLRPPLIPCAAGTPGKPGAVLIPDSNMDTTWSFARDKTPKAIPLCGNR